MSFFEIIHTQIKGFFQAGKTLVPPKDKKELFASRVFASLLLFFTLFFYSFVFGLALKMPARIYLRALLYLLPAIAFIIRFYRGVSLSWMFKGLQKYWLFTALLFYIFLILFQIYLSIFTDSSTLHIGYSGSLLLLAVGILFGVYFRMEALQLRKQDDVIVLYSQLTFGAKSKYIFYHILALFYSLFIFGGIWMFLWASGIGDWFIRVVLGW